MKRIAIPYRQNVGMMTPMPLLDLVLSYHEHTIHTTALIDSGAMISTLPFEYGQQLGLSWEEQHVNVQLGGVLHNVSAYAVILHAQIDPLIPVKLVFAWCGKIDRPIPFVLGQVNFFKQFRVDFAGSENQVFLSLDPNVKGLEQM